MTVIELLNRLIEAKFAGNQAEFARAIKRQPAQVNQWIQGVRNLGGGSIRHIEKALNIPGYFDGLLNVEPARQVSGMVPLISWVQAGDYLEAIDNLAPGQGDMIETTIPRKSHTYALRVSGDSMEPEFPDGCIIIVEPEMEPQNGDFIIVKNGSGEATFKQLVLDGSEWFLKPLNPRYPIKILPKDSTFCGVVRGMEKRYR